MEARDDGALVEARKLTYSFLSHMFLEEVTEEFLGRLAENPPATEGDLAAFVAALPSADLASVRTEAAAEFAALLLNMSADPVFPYESVYTGSERLLMQRARDEVLAAYRARGFAQADGLSIPEDHVGIELEFMARLCQEELDALAAADGDAAEEARAVQREFFAQHVASWVGELCDDLERRAKSGLYRGLAQTTRQFVAFEREELGIV